MIDLTTLEGSDTPGKVRGLATRALVPDPSDPTTPSPAAVCVYGDMVAVAKETLGGSGVQVAAGAGVAALGTALFAFAPTLFWANMGRLLIGACAAYAFSRMRFKGRRAGLMTLLLVQMFPALLTVVAIFLLLTNLGDVFPSMGVGSRLALVMVYLGGALGTNTYLMYGFFNTVPASLDEAARVDGAGHARIFFTIILRLVAPILAVVGLLSFNGTFTEFVVASVVLGNDSSKSTLAIGLYQYVSTENNTYWPIFSAGAVLAAIPVMALFLWLQKYIVSGLTAGAVK